jgi:aminoglycoside N3'-acetyltransferase
MARRKLTEEEKAERRMSKDQAFDTVSKHLKHLTFAELEEVVSLSLRFKKEKIGQEELRLIKQKEVIEQQLQKLKELDAK